MKNINVIKNTIGDWQVSDIAFIKAVSVLPSSDYRNFSLEITFLSQGRKTASSWPDTKSFFDEISIVFSDVSNLKLNFEGTSIPQIAGFDIVDVSNQGWEGINFQIEDYENDRISFNCRDVEAKSVKPAIALQW